MKLIEIDFDVEAVCLGNHRGILGLVGRAKLKAAVPIGRRSGGDHGHLEAGEFQRARAMQSEHRMNAFLEDLPVAAFGRKNADVGEAALDFVRNGEGQTVDVLIVPEGVWLDVPIEGRLGRFRQGVDRPFVKVFESGQRIIMTAVAKIVEHDQATRPSGIGQEPFRRGRLIDGVGLAPDHIRDIGFTGKPVLHVGLGPAASGFLTLG